MVREVPAERSPRVAPAAKSRCGGAGGPSAAPKKGQAYSKMAAGPKQGRLPASHKTWSPIQPAQDSTPWPEPFETLDDVRTHYCVGLGENKGAMPKKKP